MKASPYPLLKFFHLLGLTLMGAGLIGVWFADLRSRQVRQLPPPAWLWHLADRHGLWWLGVSANALAGGHGGTLCVRVH